MSAPAITLPPEYEATASKIAAVLAAFGGDSAGMKRLARHMTQDVACIRSEAAATPRPEVGEDAAKEIARLGDAARGLLAAVDDLSFDAWNRIGHTMALRRAEQIEEPHFRGLTRIMQAENSRERRLMEWIADKAGAAWKAKRGDKPPAGDRYWAYLVHGVAYAYNAKTGKVPSVYQKARTGRVASPFARLLGDVLKAAGLPMLTYGQVDRYLNKYWPEKARNWYNMK